eukprot:scaffold29974_cov79-Isochrysis_galbana.AAC.1
MVSLRTAGGARRGGVGCRRWGLRVSGGGGGGGAGLRRGDSVLLRGRVVTWDRIAISQTSVCDSC